MLKEEEYDYNPSIQWNRENAHTVGISINANGAAFGPFLDSVVRY